MSVEEPTADVTAEAATTFVSRAQPVLANQCMECHAREDHASAFKLKRVTGFEVGPHSTHANLRSVAAQLKKDDPANSPLSRQGTHRARRDEAAARSSAGRPWRSACWSRGSLSRSVRARSAHDAADAAGESLGTGSACESHWRAGVGTEYDRRIEHRSAGTPHAAEHSRG